MRNQNLNTLGWSLALTLIVSLLACSQNRPVGEAEKPKSIDITEEVFQKLDNKTLVNPRGVTLTFDSVEKKAILMVPITSTSEYLSNKSKHKGLLYKNKPVCTKIEIVEILEITNKNSDESNINDFRMNYKFLEDVLLVDEDVLKAGKTERFDKISYLENYCKNVLNKGFSLKSYSTVFSLISFDENHIQLDTIDDLFPNQNKQFSPERSKLLKFIAQ